MKSTDYLWYPYLRYQAQCKAEGKEDSIQEWLELTGKVEKQHRLAKQIAKSKPKPKRNKTSSKATGTRAKKAVAKQKKQNPLEQVLDKAAAAPISKANRDIKKVRARNKKGHYIADDPNTTENEAWTTIEIEPKIVPYSRGKSKVNKKET